MENITKRDFLQFAADNLEDEDMVAYAEERLSALDEQLARAQEKSQAKKQEDLGRIEEFVAAYMDDPTEIYTSTGLGEVAGITTQKASANLRKAEEFGLIVSRPDAGVGAAGRKIKGYALDESAFGKNIVEDSVVEAE